MPFTKKQNEALTADWDAGLTTAAIGRKMGISKNVVGKQAHRLGLTPRPSPIRRGPPAPPSVQPRAHPLPPGATTLPPLPSLADPL